MEVKLDPGYIMLHDGMGSYSVCLFVCVCAQISQPGRLILSVQAQKSFKQYNTAQSHKQLCQTETTEITDASLITSQSRADGAAPSLQKLRSENNIYQAHRV